MSDKWDLGVFEGNEDEQDSFSPIDAGTYECFVYEVSREVGKTSGNAYLKWTLKVAEGQPFAGRQIWMNTSLSEKSRWMLVKTLKALGIDVPKGPLKIGPADLQGKPCRAQVTCILDDWANEKNGTVDAMKNEVANLLPTTAPKAGVPTPAAPKAAKAKAAAKVGPKVEPEAEPVMPADDEDEFSFSD